MRALPLSFGMKRLSPFRGASPLSSSSGVVGATWSSSAAASLAFFRENFGNEIFGKEILGKEIFGSEILGREILGREILELRLELHDDALRNRISIRRFSAASGLAALTGLRSA